VDSQVFFPSARVELTPADHHTQYLQIPAKKFQSDNGASTPLLTFVPPHQAVLESSPEDLMQTTTQEKVSNVDVAFPSVRPVSWTALLHSFGWQNGVTLDSNPPIQSTGNFALRPRCPSSLRTRLDISGSRITERDCFTRSLNFTDPDFEAFQALASPVEQGRCSRSSQFTDLRQSLCEQWCQFLGPPIWEPDVNRFSSRLSKVSLSSMGQEKHFTGDSLMNSRSTEVMVMQQAGEEAWRMDLLM
jgi:hypothetical protein